MRTRMRIETFVACDGMICHDCVIPSQLPKIGTLPNTDDGDCDGGDNDNLTDSHVSQLGSQSTSQVDVSCLAYQVEAAGVSFSPQQQQQQEVGEGMCMSLNVRFKKQF